MIKQLFTSSKRTGTLRNNYLLLSIYEKIIEYELPETLEEVDLCGYKKREGEEPRKDLISTFIFEQIFDS